MVIRLYRHYNLLTKGITKSGLKDILEMIVKNESYTKEYLRRLEQVMKDLSYKATFPIQRVGIVRFNPFSDTGGSQSFTLALLDGNDTGIVMTSLYARTGNRWYLKEVVAGKGKDIELSKEELTAIKRASLTKEVS